MNELEYLLQLKQQNPTDDKILSQLAFYYLKNPDGNKELEYFKQAYELNPSIKNTHNYAFWLYYEYGQDEVALELFQQLMAKNPKSFYPYMAYGQFLYGCTNFSEDFKFLKSNSYQLIKLYQKAIPLFDNSPQEYQNSHQHELAYLYNNLANIYLVQQNFTDADNYYNQAIHVFSTISQDNQTDLNPDRLNEYLYFTALNKVRLKILADDMTTAKIFLATAKQNPQADNYDIAHLYAIMGDNQACYDIIKGQEIDLSWDWIWQAIYEIEPSDYNGQVATQIQREIIWLNEHKAELANCQESSEQEKIKEWILDGEKTLSELKNKQKQQPMLQLSIKEQCLVDLRYFSKCWLFGCEHCNNLADDE
ncbi:hypothetical protein [Moraxella sp. ZY210820]|uniref:hypothetical protein n=1 Tax=unclassified Moraxella TaxID=2685852 RepID=UPI0027313FC3|nr:hypothetical protein [Moraxella sp. ZY210820]WLF83310.1 hypothetical protein LU301_08565 [Moraxella sp. ZY210820]